VLLSIIQSLIIIYKISLFFVPKKILFSFKLVFMLGIRHAQWVVSSTLPAVMMKQEKGATSKRFFPLRYHYMQSSVWVPSRFGCVAWPLTMLPNLIALVPNHHFEYFERYGDALRQFHNYTLPFVSPNVLSFIRSKCISVYFSYLKKTLTKIIF